MGKIKRIIGYVLLMSLTMNLLPGISIRAEFNEPNLGVVEEADLKVLEESNLGVVEEANLNILEESNLEESGDLKLDSNEELNLQDSSEENLEAVNEIDVQAVNEIDVQAVEEIDSRVADMNIVSTTIVTIEDAKIWAKNRGATQTFINLADLFWKYSKTNGNINPAIAYVQSAKETGYGRFGGVIDESYFNTAGIKTPVGGDNLDPNAHHRFKNWDEGVQAHLDHLALYAGASSYPRANSPDPRHFPYLNGTASTVKGLGAKWATSSEYGVEILSLYYNLLETSKSTANLISRTIIDEVKINSNTLYVRGWALNKVGVEKVNVYLDNTLLGTANYGLTRSDVNKIYPGYPNGELSGYSAEFNIASIPAGTKTITVEQVSSVGVTNKATVSADIIRKTPRMDINSPKQNEVIKDNSLYIRGWALNDSGVKEVKVSVDGKNVGSAEYGFLRTDVNNVYPGYLNGDKSGYELKVDTKNIASGSKKVVVEAIGFDGSSTKIERIVNIPSTDKKPAKMDVNSPKQNEIIKDNSLYIRGWALNDSGVKEVKVSVDGKYIGNAQYGLLRTDVNNVYPGYPNGDKSGYELKVDAKDIASGKRKVLVEAIGLDGTVTKMEREVTITRKTPKMDINEPTQNKKVVADYLKIRGWAVNDSGVKEIKVYIDGKFVGNSDYGFERIDVNKVYPGYVGGAKSGYETQIDLANIADGSRKVEVEAIGYDGTSTKMARTVVIQNKTILPSLMSIDGPVNNEVVAKNSLLVRGWALNSSGIKEVKVFVDGNLKGNANYGLIREDVNKVYPGYKNGEKSGYDFTLDTTSLLSGDRIVEVQAVGNDGKITTMSRVIKIPAKENKVSRMDINDPVNNSKNLSGSLKVRGWALNDSGIKEVKVYINDKFIQNATIGLSRSDVDKAYPGYFNGDKSGYETNINISGLAEGNHRIKVVAIGNNNKSTEMTRIIKNTNKKIIVVDAGHNYGGDQGAFATHKGILYSETDINILIANRLRNELVANGYVVLMTREVGDKNTEDLDTSLSKRVNLANEANADLFISIHQNAYYNSDAHGTEVYYSDATPGSKGLLMNDGIDLTFERGIPRITDKVIKSSSLAKSVVDSISSKIGLYNRGVKNEDFYVIKNTNMPSILIECGFISNYDDLCKTTSTVKQIEMAKAIVEAVKKHF